MTRFVSHSWLMKVLIFTGLAIILAVFSKPLADYYQRSQLDDISVTELKTLLAQKDTVVLIDVRTEAEYQIEHIPNAISMPLATIEQRIDVIKKMTENRRLVTYCSVGPRSYDALAILKKHHLDGMNLKGGFEAWWIQTKKS